MIYGYLRVSTDEQDINSQKQGVDAFASGRGWNIDEYITDEGISGGKDPSRRKLGPLLERLQAKDIVICSEISRLGRDLYMVMDVLHFCMKRDCTVYTVKDNFILGDDIQSKVLAFAFGLAAEIERQMIRQRTKEGLALRMKSGVLLGRPIGRASSPECHKLYSRKDEVIQQFRWGVPIRRLAKNFGVDRNTVARVLIDWGERDSDVNGELLRASRQKDKEEIRRRAEQRYKDEDYKIVPVDERKMIEAIKTGKTLPIIAKEYFPEYSYEQIYDTVLCSDIFNPLYRDFGQLVAVSDRKRK